MPQVNLCNGQIAQSSGQSGPGTVTCTEAEADAFVAAGYGTRVAGT